MSKQIALYARVSSERQVEEGTIESQFASLHAYVEEQGVIAEFEREKIIEHSPPG